MTHGSAGAKRTKFWPYIVVGLVLLGLLTGCYLLLAAIAGPSCDWSSEDEQRLDSVPLGDFATGASTHAAPYCDVSEPKVLYVAARATPPPDWRDRDAVGSWRSVPQDHPDVRCYVSADDRFESVQVYVRPSGVEASIERGREPCSR